MLGAAATTFVALAWLACLFQVLQAHGAGDRRNLGAGMLVLVAGAAVVAGRGSGVGFDWLRIASLRSDAVALGVLVPTLAALAASVGLDRTRHPARWVPAAIAAVACVAAGFAALTIGRSGWYWEFVAIICGGLVLAASGVGALRWQGAGANAKLVAGSGVLLGAFFTVGGIALLLAWRALA